MPQLAPNAFGLQLPGSTQMAVEERTRYRISGSLFLLAIAVIFLPMIFDGAGVAVPIPAPVPEASTPAVEVPAYDEVVPATNVVAQVEALKSEVDDQGFSTATTERFGEPVLVPITDETSVWAVQAGSFSKQSNAQAFRSKLRASGLEAFISTSRSAVQDVHYRVAVGPLLDMADAQQIAQRVQAEFEVQPRIVAMQP